MSHGNKSYQDTYYHPGGGGTQFITFYIWTKYSLLMNFLCWISYCFDFSPLSQMLSICPWNAFVDININLRGENLRVHKIDDCSPLVFGHRKKSVRCLGVANVIVVIVHIVWTRDISVTSGCIIRTKWPRNAANIVKPGSKFLINS